MAEYVQKFPGKISVAGLDSSEPVTAPQFNGDLNGNAATATNAAAAGAVPATLVPNNADINTYRGENYWGKTFYAGGGNTVQNTPIAGIAFNLEVLRSGAFATTQRITMMAVGSNNQPTVYTRCVSDTTVAGGEGTWTAWTEVAEANGTYPNMTVGKAKGAQYLSKQININQSATGWVQIATLKKSTLPSGGNYSCIMLVSGIYNVQGQSDAAESGKIEIDVRDTGSAIQYYGLSVLGGNINPNEWCITADSNGVNVYLNLPVAFQRYLLTVESEGWQTSLSVDYIELLNTYYGTAAPSGAVYAVVRNNASGDANGNSLMSHATRNELLNGTASYDFNDYTEWGHYELQGVSGTPLVNAPTSTSNPSATDADWYLDVYRRDSFYVTQIAYSARSDGAIAIRVLSNNSWGSWRVVIDSGTVPNATNATNDGEGNNIKETYAKKNGTYPNMTVGNSTNATNATHAASADNATNATNATTAATANTLAERGKYTLLWSGSWDGESNLVVPGLSNYCAILVRWDNQYYVCYKTTNFGLGISYCFTETRITSSNSVTITSLVLRTTATITSDVFSTFDSANINTALIFNNNTSGPTISSSTVSTITEIRGIETLRVPT